MHRTVLATAGLEMFIDHPVVGVGWSRGPYEIGSDKIDHQLRSLFGADAPSGLPAEAEPDQRSQRVHRDPGGSRDRGIRLLPRAPRRGRERHPPRPARRGRRSSASRPARGARPCSSSVCSCGGTTTRCSGPNPRRSWPRRSSASWPRHRARTGDPAPAPRSFQSLTTRESLRRSESVVATRSTFVAQFRSECSFSMRVPQCTPHVLDLAGRRERDHGDAVRQRRRRRGRETKAVARRRRAADRTPGCSPTPGDRRPSPRTPPCRRSPARWR